MKIKCKEYFSYPTLARRGEVKLRDTPRGFLIVQSLTTHASTQPTVKVAKHHRQNAYNKDLNQGIVHLWSKFGGPSLNR